FRLCLLQLLYLLPQFFVKRYRLKRAKTEEEKQKIIDEVHRKRDEILEDLRRGEWEKHLINRYYGGVIRTLYWDEDVAKRIGKKHGVNIALKMWEDRSYFVSSFDPSNMTEDQIFDEIVKRADICREAYTYALTSRKEKKAFYKELRKKIEELKKAKAEKSKKRK
ncbi:MAG: hypothetical protein FGF53_09385, partial [Candidatus Brockarchaeota archaeon]|nr:hypothetical protein [Candidatus Brockarchaeota archaeon]